MTDIAQLGLEIRSDGVVVASKRLRDLEKQSGKTTRASDQLLQRAKRLSQEMSRLGRTLSTRLTLPLVGAAGGAIKLATDFDSALTQINTLVGVSRDEIALFRQEILNLAGSVGRGPVELAEGLFAITSAGQRGTAALRTLEAAAKASAIGLGASRDIALASVAAVTAYGEANLSASESVEILVGTIEQGNLSAGELSGVIGRVIGTANELGVSFADVGTFIAAFSRLGVNAAQSTTALNATLNGILKPSEDTKKAFVEMGLSIGEFRAQIQQQGFITAMQNLVNRAREMGVDIARLVPSTEALSGVLGVFGNEANDVQGILAGVSGAVGTLEERFQAVIDQDPAAAFNMMKASIDAVAIEISANLMPAWLDFLEGVKDVAVEFRELDEGTQALIVKSGLLAAALGPVLIVLGSIVTTLRTLIPLLAATGPAGWVAFAGAAAGFATLKIDQHLQDVKAGVDDLDDELRETATGWTEYTEEVNKAHRQILLLRREELEQKINRWAVAMSQMGGNSKAAQDEINKLQDQYKKLSIQLEQNSRLSKQFEEAASDAKDETEELSGSIGILADLGINLSESIQRSRDKLNEQAEATRKAKEEADAFMDMIDDMRAQLDGPAAVAIREFTEQMNTLANLEGLSPEQVSTAVMTLVANLRDRIGGEDVEQSFFDVAANGITRGIERAFESLTGSELAEMSFGQFGRVVGQSVFSELGGSLAQTLGQSLGEEFGSNLGGEMGEAAAKSFWESLSSAVSESKEGVLEAIGNFAGRYIFDKIFPQKEPKFQVGGGIGFGATGAGRISMDLSAATAFGDLFIRFRKITDEAQDQLRDALISFDKTIAGIITDEGQMTAITEALRNWGFDTQDEGMTLQRVLESRFDAIVGTFDQFGQDMIRSGATLEEQIENMLSLLIIRARIAIGDSMGEGITDNTQVFLAMELARAGESMADSFQRLITITGSLNQAFDLTGNRMTGGTAAIARFGDALQRAFGDDLERLTGGLETIFQTFFTEEERLVQQIESGRASARSLLEQLGLDVSDDLFSEAGFRDLFDTLFGTLSAEDTAILIEAGVAIADLIDAENKLAEARGDAVEQARTAAEIAREREELEIRELRLLGNTEELRRRELESLDESNRAILERIFLLQDEAQEREKQAELSQLMRDVSQDMLELISPTRAEFARLTGAFEEQIVRAQELGASEEQLGQIRSLQIMQIQRFTTDLQISILRLKEDLFGANDQFEQVGDTISRVADQVNRNIVRALESVDDWLAKSNLSSVSPLTPQQRLETAESGFRSAFESAMAGDLEALQSLPELADAFIGEAADFFGTSNQEFVSLFNSVRTMMRQASELSPEDIRPPTYDQIESLIGGVGNVNTSVNQTTSEIAKLERELKAFDLSDQIGTLAAITGRQPSEIARELGFSAQNMRDVLKLLGTDIPTLTGAALDGKFNEVVGAIGATNFLLNTVDSSLQALTTLNTIAQLTGQTPSAIAAALGFSSESMLHILRTLGVDIPEGTSEELADFFNSIVREIASGNGTNISLLRATQIIERNLWAIGDALVQVVTTLGGTFSAMDIENGISAGFSASNSSLVTAMQNIDHSVIRNTQILEQNLWSIGGVLVEIRDALQGTPSFAVGGPISHTGLANVHSGEYVVPRNGALVSSDPEVRNLLERVDLRLRNLERISETGFGAVVSEERQTRNDMRRTRQTVRA